MPECVPRVLRRPAALSQSDHRALKALADRSRIELLSLLAAAGDALCVCHLESQLGLAQPTVSHHLRVLRQAGLVSVERRGTWSFYRLEPAGLECLTRLRQLLVPARDLEKSA